MLKQAQSSEGAIHRDLAGDFATVLSLMLSYFTESSNKSGRVVPSVWVWYTGDSVRVMVKTRKEKSMSEASMTMLHILFSKVLIALLGNQPQAVEKARER